MTFHAAMKSLCIMVSIFKSFYDFLIESHKEVLKWT